MQLIITIVKKLAWVKGLKRLQTNILKIYQKRHIMLFFMIDYIKSIPLNRRPISVSKSFREKYGKI